MNSFKYLIKELDCILFQLEDSNSFRCINVHFLTSPHSVRGLIKGFSLSKEEAHTTVLLIGIRKEARSQVLHLSRNKRYTLTPEQLKWDKFKLTYKYLFLILPQVKTEAKYSFV